MEKVVEIHMSLCLDTRTLDQTVDVASHGKGRAWPRVEAAGDTRQRNRPGYCRGTMRPVDAGESTGTKDWGANGLTLSNWDRGLG
jgi:hypothetical protein